ncbi:MAG: phosphoribosylamine--glycine ligase [Salinisphaeraceae bacterium]|nr:phosphoribosylamine--glycine ligase [Salinisphaeraceae bacterium]
MSDYKVLIVGGGGREHAMAWKVAQSPKVAEVLVAPGNAGSAREPGVSNRAVAADDIEGLLALARQECIGLTIVGPEAPLAGGIVDRFAEAGLACFGPSAAAAQLESSKSFAKDFLQRHRIPTAAYASFEDLQAAEDYIRQQGAPIVVKADGLAAGKGVILAQTEAEALAAVRDMLQGNSFGAAGNRVVIEEFLEGEEASFIAMVDGDHVLPLASSQDHKAALDGDRGPNTGGMGAYSPAPVVTDSLTQAILDRVMQPTVDGMRAEGHRFTGFLYAGLMIDAAGEPRVLEFNARMGDPETQPILLRLQSDFVALVEAALAGRLDRTSTQWDERASLGVVMAAGGYPGPYERGRPIRGLPAPEAENGAVKVFHAGTRLDREQVLTDGGRVLCVCALGDTVAAAQAAAYDQVEKISWPDLHFRRDIGYRAVGRG